MNNELDKEIQKNSVRIGIMIDKLKEKTNSLSNDMQDLNHRLEADGIDSVFNGIGEIQGRGSELDNLCGRLNELKKAKESLERIKSANS